MTGSVALFSTVEDVYRLVQCRSNLIAQRRHIAVAARRFIVEKDRLQDCFVRCPAWAHANSHFPFLNAKTSAEGAPQSDPERQRSAPVLQSEELEFEDVGGATASKREPALDGKSGSSAAATAIPSLSTPKARVSILKGVRDILLGCRAGLRRGAPAPQANSVPVAIQTSTSVKQVA